MPHFVVPYLLRALAQRTIRMNELNHLFKKLRGKFPAKNSLTIYYVVLYMEREVF